MVGVWHRQFFKTWFNVGVWHRQFLNNNLYLCDIISHEHKWQIRNLIQSHKRKVTNQQLVVGTPQEVLLQNPHLELRTQLLDPLELPVKNQ